MPDPIQKVFHGIRLTDGSVAEVRDNTKAPKDNPVFTGSISLEEQGNNGNTVLAQIDGNGDQHLAGDLYVQSNSDGTGGSKVLTEEALSGINLDVDFDDIIKVQDEEPEDEDTKIWLPEMQAPGIQVPTYAEFLAAISSAHMDVATIAETQTIIDGFGGEEDEMLVETEFYNPDPGTSNPAFRTILDAEDITDAFKHGKNIVVHFPASSDTAYYGIVGDGYSQMIMYHEGGVNPGGNPSLFVTNYGFVQSYLHVVTENNAGALDPTDWFSEVYTEEDGKLYFKIFVN